MNLTRIAILAVAAIAAGAAALLVRGMLGGGTPPVQASLPPPAITTDVLVAAKELPPGQPLDPASVRWEPWPKSAVASSFITKDAQPDISKAIARVVVRSPLVTGQPITDANTVHTDSVGFLAATVTPGMRAVAIPVSADTGASRTTFRTVWAPRTSRRRRSSAMCASSLSTRHPSLRRIRTRRLARLRLWNSARPRPKP